jgi:hypothetical protein
MRKGLTIGTLLATAAVSGLAQEPAKFTVAFDPQSMAPARASTVVETRITTGRPYTAEATTEFVQTLGDGNKITRKAVVLYRDGEGRTRREELGTDGAVRLISIYDPVAHTTYVLDPATRIARKSAVRVMLPTTISDEDKRKAESMMRTELDARGRAGGRVALVAPAEVPGQAVPDEMRKRMVETVVSAPGAGRGVVQPAVRGDDVKNEESLGQKMFDGVLADGKRVTTVLPAGSIGNQQPITVLSEQWFAPDLEVLVMTRHSDPRTGETSYSLTNITRGEPAAGLFDVPNDYTSQESSYMRSPAR